MYPYQYSWLNPFSNFINVNNKFELDYWGVSGRNIANKINKNELLQSQKGKCIYVSPIHVVKPFIRDDFNCVKPFFSIYPSCYITYFME